MQRLILVALSLIACAPFASAQSARAILEQALQVHGRAKVTDITTTGSVRQNNITHTLTLYAKGSAVGRLENGGAGDRHLLLFNTGQAWGGPESQLKFLNPQTALRRMTLIPFLDLIDALDSPGIEITEIGIENVNGSPAHRISVKTHDPDGAKRFLRRPLEEYVEFFVDAKTFLIVRSQRMRTMEENLDMQVPSILDFSDYRLVSGVAVPYHIVNTIGLAGQGFYQSMTDWTTVTINSSLPDTLFTPAK
jgi:hypothetical protein